MTAGKLVIIFLIILVSCVQDILQIHFFLISYNKSLIFSLFKVRVKSVDAMINPKNKFLARNKNRCIWMNRCIDVSGTDLSV